MSDQILVQVRFKVQTEQGEYNDALYYPLDVYQSMDKKVIEDEKAQRVSNWVQSIKNPPVQDEPTKQQLEESKAMLVEQISQLDTQIASK
jgi:hypothetical protein